MLDATLCAGSVILVGATVGLFGQVYGLASSIKLTAIEVAPMPTDLALGAMVSTALEVVGGSIGIFGAIMLVHSLRRLNRFDKLKRERSGAAFACEEIAS